MAKTVRESSLASELFVELPIVGSTTRTNRSAHRNSKRASLFLALSFRCATLVEIYIYTGEYTEYIYTSIYANFTAQPTRFIIIFHIFIEKSLINTITIWRRVFLWRTRH